MRAATSARPVSSPSCPRTGTAYSTRTPWTAWSSACTTELQRLSEELRIGERLTHLLGPLFAAIRDTTGPGPYRLVDVGCGLGYLIRWLATTNALGTDVELGGVDRDAALIGEADRLARAEGLNCRLVRGNAFDLPEAATVYVSTGVLHHFRGPALAEFFRIQTASPAYAFCHLDIAATPLAPWAPGSSIASGCATRSAGTTASSPRGVRTATRRCCAPLWYPASAHCCTSRGVR
ncbi:class I SAM-dependent methyltransferase [Streptomyces sp. NPDC060188]|uniref:class I SAM-dependent methyltransferase n=1 Tax=Streptomyces sp. NPDC060188 TaxID=3347068 RepID=UPI0036590508